MARRISRALRPLWPGQTCKRIAPASGYTKVYAPILSATTGPQAFALRAWPQPGGAASVPGHDAERGRAPGSVFLPDCRGSALPAGLRLFHRQSVQRGDFRDRKFRHGNGRGEFHRAGHQVRAAQQRFLRRPHRGNGAPPGRQGGAPRTSRGASRSIPGSPRIHPARTAASGGHGAGRNLHRHVQPGKSGGRSGARSGCADDRRLRHVAGRHAGAGGRKRHRYRI